MKTILNRLIIVIVFIAFTIACEREDIVESPEIETDETIFEASEGNVSDHEEESDYLWDENQVIHVSLDGQSISSDGSGVTINGSLITIISAGTYSLEGTLSDGRIIVNTEDKEVVRLILNSARITCSSNSPIYIKDAKKTVIVLAQGTNNSLTDGSNYIYEDVTVDDPNAVIYSKSDLSIFGEGSLEINSNFNDGISSVDGLILNSGNISINSVDDGIRGKDYLVVRNAIVSIKAAGDGLKSDNEDYSGKGYISIDSGIFSINSGGDAISAQTDVLISNGEFEIVSGGGSLYSKSDALSTKGVKALSSLIVEDGTFVINTCDDAFHTNANMNIKGGYITLATADDGFHADSSLVFNGGDIKITKSYEGIESAIITFNDGTIDLTSSDDGINISPGLATGGGGFRPVSDAIEELYYLYINGGHIFVQAGGDGIDINGSVVMTGGELIVVGPTANNNGALDYDGTFKMSGGSIIAAGSSGMAMAPDASSSQYSILITFKSSLAAGTICNIQNSKGIDVLNFAPSKKYQTLVLSSSDFVIGETYSVYTGGSYVGTLSDCVYLDGIYTPGTLFKSFSISSIVTKVN